MHTWSLPKKAKHREHFELLGNGEVVVVCVLEGLVKLDRNSRIVWVSEMPVHHDVEVLVDGSFLTPRWPGGFSSLPRGRRVVFAGLACLSARGQMLDLWSTWEELAQLRKDHLPTSLDEPFEGPTSRKSYGYHHLDTVEVLPDTPLGMEEGRFQPGNLLICLRNADVILIPDKDTRHVVGSWGEVS